MKHTNQKLKLIGILTPILILAGIILIALTGNKVNILKTQVAEETGKITQETETAKVYDAYMLINELSKIDGTDLNGNGNGIKITTSADDLTLKAYSVVNDELISENENKDIIVPESGIKLKVEGITEGKTYEIEIANGTTDAEYKTDFVKAVITIDATGEDSLVAYVKETTKVVNGEEITEEGSKEETAIFMYEDETNKIKIKGNGDLEMYYTLGSLDGLTEEELKTATWKEYDKTNGLEVEHNCKIYAKSKYKTGEYSDISEIRVDNIDKLAPTITVTGKEEKAEESTSVTVKITDEENEKYGASGIVAYKMTKMETEPKEWIEIENTKEYETEIGEIQKNGTYYLWAKDKVGNVGHVSFDVTNIEVKVVAVILDSPVESLIGTEYTSLEALQTALEENNITAESGKVVVQLENNVYYETMKIANKDITIDLNGYMIKAKTEEPVIDVESGKVNLVDGKYKLADYITNTEKAEELAGKYTAQNDYGKIINETGNGINIEEGAEFTLGTDDELISIASPEIKAGETGIHNNNGTFNFYDGIITAKITNDGSTTVEGEKVETGITDTPRLYDPTTRQTEGEEGKYTTYLAKVSGIEAVIGKTRYTKLEYAIEAANDLKGTPETQVRIDLVKDINKDASIEINNTKNIILNLNGYTLTNSVADYVIKNAGKLEITDISETQKGTIKSSTAGVINNAESAELKLTNGTIELTKSGTSSNYVYAINNMGKFEGAGGNVSTTAAYTIAFRNIGIEECNITGGNYTCSGRPSRTIQNNTESTVTIKNTTISNTQYDTYSINNISSGNIVLKDCIVSGMNQIIHNANTGNINITAGSIKQTYNYSTAVCNEGKGEITVDGTDIQAYTGFNINSAGTLNIKNINFTASSLNQSVNITSGGKVNIENSTMNYYIYSNNGTINANNLTLNKEMNLYNTTLNMKSSNINSEIYGRDNVVMNLNGGNVVNNANGVGIYVQKGSILTILNDTITGSNYGIQNEGTTTLGTKDGNYIEDSNMVTGGTYGIYSISGTFNFYDGKIRGKTDSIYGYFDDIEDNLEILFKSEDEYENSILGNKTDPIAQVGEEKFVRLQDAINACTDNSEIIILKNIKETSQLNVSENKNIKINLEEYTLKFYFRGSNILNNGNITIYSENKTGKICGVSPVLLENNDNLTIEGVIFEGIENAIKNNETGHVTIKSGTMTTSNSTSKTIYNEGQVDIEDILLNVTQTVESGKKYGIYNTGALNIKGGKIALVQRGRYAQVVGIQTEGKGTVIYDGMVITSSQENTYSGSSGVVNNGTGEITIKSGKIHAAGAYSTVGCVFNYSTGTVKIEGGTITGGWYTNVNADQGIIYNTAEGNIEITGGEMTGRTCNQGAGKITIKGTAKFNGTYGVQNESKGTIEIAGGEITGTDVGAYNGNVGTLIITDGTITGANHGVYNNSTGSVIIGEKGEPVSKEKPAITGTNTTSYGIYNNNASGNIYFYDGILKGKTNSKHADIVEWEPEYDIITERNEEYEITYLAQLPLVQVGSDENNTYRTIKAGIEACEDNTETEMKLLRNLSIGKAEEAIEIPESKNIIFNLNGNKIETGATTTFINNGTLKLYSEDGTGSIIGTSTTVIENKKELTLEGVILQGMENVLKNDETGHVTIKNGTLSTNNGGSKTIYNEGQVDIEDILLNVTQTVESGKKYGIYNTGALNIKGGKIALVQRGRYAQVVGIQTEGEGTVIYDGMVITSSQENTYSGSSGVVNNGTGEITIKSGKIHAAGAYSTVGCVFNYSTGTVKIEGGTITGGWYTNVNADQGIIYNTAEGNIEITGGEMTGRTYNQGAGKITIKGTAKFNGTYGVQNESKGTIEIAGGEITGTDVGAYNGNVGTLIITDGTITGANHGVYNNSTGSVIIGEKGEPVSKEKPAITGTNTTSYGIYNNNASGNIYFYDGILKGKTNSKHADIVEWEPEYDIITERNEEYEITYLAQLPLVQVGSDENNTYRTIKAGIEACEDNTETEMKLLRNLSIGKAEEAIEIPESKNIIFNLNGNKIETGATTTFINNGTLKLYSEDGTGSIIGTSTTVIENKKELTLEGVILQGMENVLKNDETGHVTIKNGTLSTNNGGSKTIYNEGQVDIEDILLNVTQTVESGKKYGIYNTGALNIKGGKIALVQRGRYAQVVGIQTEGEGTVIYDGMVITSSQENTYSGSSGVVNNGTGEITIKSGKIHAAGAYSTVGCVFNYSTGTVKIEGGTITGGWYTNVNADQGIIYNTAEGNIEITGGEMTGRTYNQGAGKITIKGTAKFNGTYGVQNESKGTIEIAGGEITGTDVGAYNGNVGTLIITNGTITGTNYGIYNNNSGIVTVTGGIITGNTQAGMYNKSTGTITLGEDDELIPNQTTPKVIGKTYGIYNANTNGIINFYDGIVTGETSAIYGTVTSVPDGYTIIYKDSSETTAVIGKAADFDNRICVDGTYYDTLDSAIAVITNKANKTGRILLYSDVELLTPATIPEGVNITLEMQGQRMLYRSGTDAAITNNGTLTIIDYADLSDGDSDTISSIENTQGIAIQNNGTLTIGQANNNNMTSPKIIGTTAIAGNEATKLSGTITNTNSTVGMAQSRQIAKIQKMEENNQTANDTKTKLSSTPDLIVESTEWTKENVPVGMRADITPILNLYLVENIKTAEYKVEYYYDGKIDESKTFTDEVDIGTQINSYEDKVKEGYVLEKVEGIPLTVEENTDNNVIKVYYTKRIDLSYTVNYLEKGTNKIIHESKTVTDKTYGDTVQATQEIIEIDGYNYESSDKETLTITTEGNEINIYYIKKKDLRYTVNYLEKETNNKLHESKVQGNMTYESTVISNDEVIEIEGYNYDSVDKPTISITTGINEINIYYTKRIDLSYTVNYLEKETNKTLLESKIVKNQTYGTSIDIESEKVEINGYNYDSTDKTELIIGTDVNVLNIYYTKKNDLSYTVNYLEKGTNKVLYEAKTYNNQVFETKINAVDEAININGYKYDSSSVETLTIGTGENVINIYYTKVDGLSYTINYLEKYTNKVLHEPETKGNQTYENEITSRNEVIEIDGYNYESADPETLVIGTTDNIINIYYTKKNDLSYTVNYLEKDTDKVLHEAKVVENKTFEEVVTSSNEIIEIDGYYYDSVDPETLVVGTNENIINIYYTKRNDLSYTVNYLEKDTDKVLHEAKVIENKTFEDVVISSDEIIEIDGYNYDSVDPENLTITTGANVINIYYTKRNDLSYTVNYLEKDTDKVLHEAKVVNNKTFEELITSSNEVIEIDGYNYESTDPETLVIGTTDNIINIYYTKKNDLSYTVNYLEKDTDKVLHEAKVVENKTFEEVVTSSDEIIEINGYNYDSVNPENLTITTGANVINIYYTKRNDLSYTVNYLEKDTDKVLHEAKVVENKTFEEVVTSSNEIIKIDGYNYDSVDPENLTITTGTNVINIYYTKRNDLSYTVKYIDRDTKEEIQEEKIVTGKTYKETVNAEEEKTEIYGYNYETADPEVLTIEVENNVINLYYTRKTSTVVIKHCEEGTEQQISENVVITGKVGEKYKAEIAEDIPEKYEFTRAEGETEGTITEEPQTITMYYSKKATKVIVNYINEETQEKMKDSEGQEIESIEIEGKVDDFYTTVSSIKIPSKYELVEIPENSAGRMTIDEITVNYYYRRKETRVVVHHYEEGTTNKLSENVVITGKVDDTYETKAATDIPVKYEYAYVEGDTAGIMTEEEIHIFYYYKVKESKLTVKYVDKNHDTEIIQADETIGKVDDKYETQAREIEGYTLVGNSENTEGTLKVGATEVIYYYKKNTAVQVKYIDIDTNKELSQETIEGLERDEYQTESKNFEKYVLVKETENTEGTMTREEIIVKYYYEHLSKGVIEKHIDITTNEILENKVYTGKYGTPYTTKVKTIEGYDVVEERLPENAEGTMIEDVIEVNYYYIAKAKINVEYIDRATGKNLDISDVIIGHEGDTYQTEEKTFEGYDLIEIVGNAEGTMTKGETTIKYIYARPTKVIVRYIDQITGKNLVTSTVGGDVPGDPITIIGHEGDAYQTEEKTITGYDLVKTSENTEGRMTKEDIEVTYYYIAKTRVIVNYIDRVTGESLITSDIEPITITGHEGDTYKTESKTFAGYDLVKTSENTEGRMTKETIEVTYYYARPAKVIVNYLDEETGKTIENIKEEIITGYEGDSYKTEAKKLEYYRVARTSENTEGIMEVRVEKEIIDNTTIVNYYYKKKDYNFSIEKTLESVKKDEKTTEITGTIGKVELTEGQLKTAKVQVVYNIKVKNTGEIAGKVKVLEKIPAGMKMNKEDNPGWEISNTVATIETNEIEPGKEENIKVVLTWINSETNLGTIENIAEIQDTSSKSGFKDNNSKDDTDKIDIIVAISTGEKTYIATMGLILSLLSVGVVILIAEQRKNN